MMASGIIATSGDRIEYGDPAIKYSEIVAAEKTTDDNDTETTVNNNEDNASEANEKAKNYVLFFKDHTLANQNTDCIATYEENTSIGTYIEQKASDNLADILDNAFVELLNITAPFPNAFRLDNITPPGSPASDYFF